MTATAPAAAPVLPETTAPSRGRAALSAAGRWAAALLGALVLFCLLLAAKGADPLAVLSGMVTSTLTSPPTLEQIAIKAVPLVLAALAVVIPARAGLTNVGGEGQVVIGAVAAAGIGLALDPRLAGSLVLVLLLAGGALAGAAWAGLAAALRLTAGVNEAVTTLLLNYIALDVLLYLIYEPWKDPAGSGQPATRPLEVAARLPLLAGTAVHVGVIVALLAAAGTWFALRRTAFGFRLGVVGGNPEAAGRAGLPVRRLLLTAMLVGGALAGLAGAVHLAGVEFKLRPGLTTNIGYLAFLASWLVRHRPLPVIGAALLLAGVTIAGDSLQLDSGLPAATVHVLTGLVLLAVLGWTRRKGSDR
ncbi:ABC transporter permease [Actinomadura craniellae]|uniref:ABC transporter permease n=1 Tax=Actinomadura craniellae TaxID=2231787 RepID=A0A365HAN0_9ACTN|nr:ABC transporter permease [Actinomadura craniellae]RAY16204.1 ABC transporter permease [Actinomadura craniellae]